MVLMRAWLVAHAFGVAIRLIVGRLEEMCGDGDVVVYQHGAERLDGVLELCHVRVDVGGCYRQLTVGVQDGCTTLARSRGQRSGCRRRCRRRRGSRTTCDCCGVCWNWIGGEAR